MFKYLTFVTMLYSVVRVSVLFLESLSIVKSQRAEDYELLQACENGTARGSSKMREACLKARSDLASPLAFQAVVYAFRTAYHEFFESFNTPFRAFTLILFGLGSVGAPLVQILSAVVAFACSHDASVRSSMMHTKAYDDGMSYVTVIHQNQDIEDENPRYASRLSTALRRAVSTRRKSSPEHDNEDLEPGRYGLHSPQYGNGIINIPLIDSESKKTM